ncbi:maleylpyruvate isomerase N-terminal domain-containing protein [Streptomyces sp. APSN-46.1]|uniref:maleylpyruvate isomerase N-terminal domain-containing protein n=1 Tax=Streptomyces sp. APSN-46.1 TaxID=2929049 RepID=UPI0035AC230E
MRLIDERSTAFRAAVASAPSLDVQVPTCPEWTLFDLVRHLGEGRRSWAATVAAGPVATAKSASAGAPAAPREREALLAWLAASTQELLDALREAGPDRGCWTWWGTSQSPRTCGAVARHQLQENLTYLWRLATRTSCARVDLELAAVISGGGTGVGGPRKDTPLPVGECRCKACPALDTGPGLLLEAGAFCRTWPIRQRATAGDAARGVSRLLHPARRASAGRTPRAA